MADINISLSDPPPSYIYCRGDIFNAGDITVYSSCEAGDNPVPVSVSLGNDPIEMLATSTPYYYSNRYTEALNIPGYITVYALDECDQSSYIDIVVAAVVDYWVVGHERDNGTDYAAYKGSPSQYVTVEVTLNPNLNAVANAVLEWTAGDAVPDYPRRHRVSRSVVAEMEITAYIGNSSITANIWIIEFSMFSPSGDPVNNPSDGYNQFTFNKATPGVVVIDVMVHVHPYNARFIIKDWCSFSASEIANSAQTKSSIITHSTGLWQVFTNTGLPYLCSDFGTKTAEVFFAGIKRSQNTYEVFFDSTDEAWNNPGGSTPNWFYYWSDTSAKKSGSTIYYFNVDTYGLCNPLDEPDYRCYLGNWCNDSRITPPVGKNANTNLHGIDLFAFVARHEWRHHEQLNAWWGSSGWDPVNYDTDYDHIRDTLEANIPSNEGGPFVTNRYDTYGPPWFPDDGCLDDCERNAHFTQDEWTVGGAKYEDWGNPGMQHGRLGYHE